MGEGGQKNYWGGRDRDEFESDLRVNVRPNKKNGKGECTYVGWISGGRM